MSSIRKVQIERVLEDVARALYAQGVKPTLNDILGQVSSYFAQYPAGVPLPLPLDYIKNGFVSNVDKFNQVLAHLVMNMDVVYEASLDQVDDVMLLTTTLRSHLERLRAQRRRTEAKIDDYLLSLYNSDGYYFSISDTFSDTAFADLSLTSAQIDTNLGSVVLPTIAALTRQLDPRLVGQPVITATNGSKDMPFSTRGEWSGAVDGLSNTLWAVEVPSENQSEIIVTLLMPVGDVDNPVHLSRIDFDPYGVVPVQVFIETAQRTSSQAVQSFSGFGNKVETSSNKMMFIDSVREVTDVRITLRKTVVDYVEQEQGISSYRYIFGAKDITFLHNNYDREATYVSAPLKIEEELTHDMVIDAVSLVTDDDIPLNTEIKYYIAADTSTLTPEISDFSWKQISPIDAISRDLTTVVRFEGAVLTKVSIRSQPEGTDISLTPLDTTHADWGKRNPSPIIIPAVDTYRLCKFDPDPLLNTLKLEEGVNTVRIYSIAKDVDATSLDFWIDKLENADVDYHRIDTGNEFFYGGVLGAGNKSVYVETYLESLSDQQPLVARFKKGDSNSITWDIKVYLNGSEVGNLPAGTDELLIPWTFQAGLNHIAMVINIPQFTTAILHPYDGTINLLEDAHLYDFGSVRLAEWKYVSFFDLVYNQVGQPFSFTIKDGEILSRRKPTDNFDLLYGVNSGRGPGAVRVRADLSRGTDNPSVSPRLNSYRLRFSYGALQSTI